ncbi:hypothetical protein DIPPA_14603 [Diplonema papillatum]|nr:hypothetical protein DIPPA_14603 [Diplonema papillatum]
MASALHQCLADSDEVEEEAEWFDAPALLRNTAAERYVAKWQVLRSVAEDGVAWDFEVPFQPFTDRSLNEQVPGPFHSGLFRAGDFDWRLCFAAAAGDSGAVALAVSLENAHTQVAPPHWQCEVVATMEIVGLKAVAAAPKQPRIAGKYTRQRATQDPFFVEHETNQTDDVFPRKLILRGKNDGDDLTTNTQSLKLVTPLASIQSACVERRFGSFVGKFFTVRVTLNAGRTLKRDAADMLSNVNVASEFEHPIRKRDRLYREAIGKNLFLQGMAMQHGQGGVPSASHRKPLNVSTETHILPKNDDESDCSYPGWQ